MRAAFWSVIVLVVSLPLTAQEPPERPRARDVGIVVGTLEPGTLNAITDVDGVRVGHATVRSGDSIHTGVTAILPPGERWFQERVPAAVVVGNGFGKLVGITQIDELGELETPVLLTCTLCVWRVADALVDWLLRRPGMENVGSINPVVGETNDGGLNAIRSRPVTPEHVVAALEGARGGPVEEGAVGAGTGTRALGFKGGIGTSSRVLAESDGGFTVGVLVQTNYGGSLTILGVPVGRELTAGAPGDDTGDGSIMIVVATDAPLDSRNLERLARRALIGLARTGSVMSNGSGDYVIAFSTAEGVRRVGAGPFTVQQLGNGAMSDLFTAVADATEEAIYNSLFRAVTVRARSSTAEELPLERVLEILERRGALVPATR
jgi:D-aminopeptidase